MPCKFTRSALAILSIAIVSAATAFAQSEEISLKTFENAYVNDWQIAQQVSRNKGKLFVVTTDQPDRKQTCRVRSFTSDQLVCSRGIGGSRTYSPKQILALIVHGDDDLRIRLVLGFNAGLGVAIWGTVVLAAACPVCAVATAIAAFFCFGAAGATLIGDGQPDRLLYLAPGQELSRKLSYVQR